MKNILIRVCGYPIAVFIVAISLGTFAPARSEGLPTVISEETAQNLRDNVISEQYRSYRNSLLLVIDICRKWDVDGIYFYPFDGNNQVFLIWPGYPYKLLTDHLDTPYQKDVDRALKTDWQHKAASLNQMEFEYLTGAREFANFSVPSDQLEKEHEGVLALIAVGDDENGFRIWMDGSARREEHLEQVNAIVVAARTLAPVENHPEIGPDEERKLQTKFNAAWNAVGTDEFAGRLTAYYWEYETIMPKHYEWE